MWILADPAARSPAPPGTGSRAARCPRTRACPHPHATRTPPASAITRTRAQAARAPPGPPSTTSSASTALPPPPTLLLSKLLLSQPSAPAVGDGRYATLAPGARDGARHCGARPCARERRCARSPCEKSPARGAGCSGRSVAVCFSVGCGRGAGAEGGAGSCQAPPPSAPRSTEAWCTPVLRMSFFWPVTCQGRTGGALARSRRNFAQSAAAWLSLKGMSAPALASVLASH